MQKSGRMSAKTQASARSKALSENPGWRVVRIKKLYTMYHVSLEKIETPKKRGKK